MNTETLYTEIENRIIRWSNDGTRTAGELTREIMELIENQNSDKDVLDIDYMYKWINKHSNRNKN